MLIGWHEAWHTPRQRDENECHQLTGFTLLALIFERPSVCLGGTLPEDVCPTGATPQGSNDVGHGRIKKMLKRVARLGPRIEKCSM